MFYLKNKVYYKKIFINTLVADFYDLVKVRGNYQGNFLKYVQLCLMNKEY